MPDRPQAFFGTSLAKVPIQRHSDRLVMLPSTALISVRSCIPKDIILRQSLTNSSPDLESGADTSYMDILASSLQSYSKTSSLERYISAAPLCANNTVLPYGFYANANFVWPRFYNAKACCFGSKGFQNSVTSWYNFLGSVVSDLGSAYPRNLSWWPELQ
jgi:hypothetical protein